MDVNVGEVWLAGGQSNMEFFMRYDENYASEVAQCANEDIRFFDVPEVCYEGQEQDFDYSRMGFWRTCIPENLKYYSAVGYYHAKKLWQELQVPVGIIGCNKGGSCVQTWMSQEALKKHGQVWLDDYEAEIAQVDYSAYKESMRHAPQMNMGNPFGDTVSDKLQYGVGVEQQSELMEQTTLAQKNTPLIHYDNRPGCYYEYMLKTIAGVAVRGVIWYQGESEVFHPECYPEIFADMIDCWRGLWQDNLPFHCVQLAPFQNWMACYGTDFPVIRRKQWELSCEKEGVHLVSSSDVGRRYDIHPKKKQPIGQRLALSALKYEYKQAIQADAPVGVRVRAVGSDLYLDFAGDMDTLEVKGSKIVALQLFGSDHEAERELSFDSEDFVIEGKTLILRNANAGKNRISRVVFAGLDYYEVNLYGSNGLPAMPFTCSVELQ